MSTYSEQYWNSLTSQQQAWFILNEGEKLIDFWDGSLGDEVVSITINGTPYSASSVNALVSNYSSVFNVLRNDNGQMDLIAKAPSTAGNILGSFKAVTTSLPYNMMSQDCPIVGPRPIPPTRCPLCP